MENYRKMDDLLHISKYGIPRQGDANLIWKKIKEDKELLKWAIKQTKDKFGESDLVNGLTICDTILVDYHSVYNDIYQELINLIYSNEQIARLVLDGASNGGYSFLLMSLWNPNLILTEEQKKFAITEAKYKIGTIHWDREQEKFLGKLDEMGITDDEISILDIDGCKNPVGRKTGSEYMNYMFATLSDTQAHGSGAFDIRYWILRNPNWSLEEKEKLIYDFWSDGEIYDEFLEQWEWGIINDSENYKDMPLPQLDKCELYFYEYSELLKFYGDEETTNRIWQEIEFCKQMHKIRPQQWELDIQAPVKKYNLN